MQIKVVEVNIEKVVKGRNSYQIATVQYQSNGEARVQKVISFANPDSYAKISVANPGDVFNITVTKNDAGYNQWAKVEKVDADATTAVVKGGTYTPSKSTYETPEERKIKQLLIVKQSSIGAAIASLSIGAKAPLDPAQVISIAQQFVDWIYFDDAEDILASGFANSEEVSGD